MQHWLTSMSTASALIKHCIHANSDFHLSAALPMYDQLSPPFCLKIDCPSCMQYSACSHGWAACPHSRIDDHLSAAMHVLAWALYTWGLTTIRFARLRPPAGSLHAGEGACIPCA